LQEPIAVDFSIASILTQDGVVNGAVYALVGLSIVLVFSVTRVILVPQGEFVTFGTLTMALLQTGRVPGTFWLLVGVSLLTALFVIGRRIRGGAEHRVLWPLIGIVLPLLLAAFVVFVLDAPRGGLFLQTIATLLIVVPLAPMMYQTIYAPLANASILVLLIVSVALHLVLQQAGLIFFGAEGFRTTALFTIPIEFGPVQLSGASASVIVIAALTTVVFAVLFSFTLFGKALRATAGNATGARLVGIRPTLAGTIAFGLAGLLGVVSGLMIGPITTVYYDTGFLIALKGFVAATIGGLHSYPLAIVGSLFVGITESFASFYASAFKDAIVFALLLPILFWRSLRATGVEEE
jgi:branched-subunit amino acid ABC-type transport system permease component